MDGGASNNYILLGDDLVISGQSTSSAYKRIVQDLGMEINLTKTLESKTSFEFAKRYYISGIEHSPMPIGQIKHATTQY